MEQLSLWTYDAEGINIPEVADNLHVSVATIRNWIRMGYLQSLSSNMVSKDSVARFAEEYIGKRKLVSRANKIHRSTLSVAFDVDAYSEAIVAKAYESSLSDSYKNKEGVFYTPEYIVQNMMKDIQVDENATFLEPCCGSGNFILEALKHGFSPQNIYAFDIDPIAVEITKRRLFAATGFHSENIVCADFLQIAKNIDRRFDYIYSNPPWGKKIEREKKALYSKMFAIGKNTDTAGLFYLASLSLLNKGGEMGFLLPEAFFNVAAFEDIRTKVLSQSAVSRIVDYGRAFQGLMTKAIALVTHNTIAKREQLVSCEVHGEQKVRTQTSFDINPKHILNYACASEEAEVIEYLYSLPHTTLKDKAEWGLGIVTGDNQKWCSDVPFVDSVPVFRGKDITKKELKAPSAYIKKDLTGCQQVASMALYLAPEKLIYRFISNELVFYCDTAQHYILNSANMLVLHQDFPLTGKQLADVMNSDLMGWLFQSLFATNKILRGDLERLPIFTEYFTQNMKFDEDQYLDFLHIQKKDGTYRIKR